MRRNTVHRNIMVVVVTFVAAVSLSQVVQVIPVKAVTGSCIGNWDGKLVKMIDGSGMTITNAFDPSTWISGGGYQQEWQTLKFIESGANSKIAWATYDFSNEARFVNFYIWNLMDGGGSRGIKEYNVYYSVSPTVTPPQPPADQGQCVDYDFDSGGWTLYNTSDKLLLDENTTGSVTWTNDLTGITARYIGVEILADHGGMANRVGIAEVAFTEMRMVGAVISIW